MRAAADDGEVKALAARYKEALDNAKARGADVLVEAFERAVGDSHAVVNLELMRLLDLVSKEQTLYANYHLAVKAEVREAAKAEFDRHRRAVDAILFGRYAEELRYAALSIDGRGLKSYGKYTIVLKDVAVAKRSSVLEENSFHFCKRHALKPGDPIPEGYRAVWGQRQKLAVAKLADAITSNTTVSSFTSLLLHSASTRGEDDYVEVQIFGAFNNGAIEAVVGATTSTRPSESAMAAVAKELILKSGKSWVDA